MFARNAISLAEQPISKGCSSVPDIVTLTINPAVIFCQRYPRRADPEMRCSAPKRDPGGGGINVARAAHRWGHRGGDLSNGRRAGIAASAGGRARGHRKSGDAVARLRRGKILRRTKQRPASSIASCCQVGASSRRVGGGSYKLATLPGSETFGGGTAKACLRVYQSIFLTRGSTSKQRPATRR